MVKPIPVGTHTVTPHLIIKGAARAIEFYAAAFGAVEHYRMPGPDGRSVAHAELKIGDSLVYLADEFPGGADSPASLGGTSVVIHLFVEDVDAWFARAVKAGAKVKMPATDMFWGDRYGQVEDPFGHVWSIATHVEDLGPEERAKRAKDAFASMAAAAPVPPAKAGKKKTARPAAGARRGKKR